MSAPIGFDQLKKVLPKTLQRNLTQEMVDKFNGVICNEHERDMYRENLLSYTGVMKEGKYKIQSYMEAVRYVSHKLLGDTNIAAYIKCFPERHAKMVANKLPDKDIASAIHAYNKNQLVNKILEQTLIPSHVLNADLYQKALNTQAALMIGANSEKVRCDAANSLLQHLKAPEVQKIELDIGLKEDSAVNALRQTTLELVAQQKKMIQAGAMTVEQIAHSKVVPVDAEFVEVK